MTTTTALPATWCPRCSTYVGTADAFCRHCGLGRLAGPGWYPNPDPSVRGLRWWEGTTWSPVVHGGADAHRAQAGDSDITSEVEQQRSVGLPGFGLAVLGFLAGSLAAKGVIELLRHHGRPGGLVAALVLSELALWAGLLAPVVWVSRRRGTGSLARDFGLRIRWRDLGIGTLGAIIGRSTTVIVAIPLYAAFHDLLRNPSVGVDAGTLSGGTLAAYAVLACIGAPIVEETLFRGLIQPRMINRFGVVRGIAVTSVLFGSAHLIGWQGPASLLAAAAIASGGAVLGYVRWRTGRLGTSMVAHALFNSLAILLVAAGVGS